MNPKQREALYDRCRDGLPYPLCNLCGLPVYPGDSWDESHFPVPKSLGGTETGIAHMRCNRDHGAKIVTRIYILDKRDCVPIMATIGDRHVRSRLSEPHFPG